MRAALLVALLLTLAGSAAAQRDELRWPDYALATVSSALVVADWGQTHHAVQLGYPENNPLLGRFPSHERVNWVNAGQLVVNVALLRLNNATLRRVLWGITIGANYAAVINNHRVGLKWRMVLRF